MEETKKERFINETVSNLVTTCGVPEDCRELVRAFIRDAVNFSETESMRRMNTEIFSFLKTESNPDKAA